MEQIGLRELRQNASKLVRRVQAGETVTVTVSGRPAIQMVPMGRSRWRVWADVSAIFDGDGVDDDWARDRDLMDQAPSDPWARG